jgi:hypothetical protein
VAWRKKGVGVDRLSDADLLDRVLGRDDLDAYESGAFENMRDALHDRVEVYGDDAYGLTDLQREWAERVTARIKTRMTGEEFSEMVREIIGRDLRLRN